MSEPWTGTLLSVTTLSKYEITHGNGTVSNIEEMEDTGWSRCEGLWDRLMWARINAPSVKMSPAEAAAVVGVKPGTYRAYERRPTASKTITINPQFIIELGRRWRISWQWILSGEGTPFDKELSPVQLRVVAAMEAAPPDLQERAAAAIEALLTGTHG